MTHEQVRKKILALVKKYGKWYKLDNWDIAVMFCDIEDADPTSTTVASCSACAEYREATIRFDIAKIIKTKESLDLVVRHELAHCRNSALESLCEWFLIDGYKAREEMFRRVKEGAATDLERMSDNGR